MFCDTVNELDHIYVKALASMCFVITLIFLINCTTVVHLKICLSPLLSKLLIRSFFHYNQY